MIKQIKIGIQQVAGLPLLAVELLQETRMKINVLPVSPAWLGRLVLGLSILTGGSVFSAQLSFVSPNNQIPWQAGVPGGIPQRTTIFTTLSPGASAAQINSAIASCPSNQVVFLSAGTYNLNGQITINKSGVTLRGAGPKNTILMFSGTSPQALIDFNGNSPWNPASTRLKNWTAGYTKGNTTITLDSIGDLTVGNLLVLDQNADNILVVPPAAGTGGDLGRGNTRQQFQVVRVTGISGNNVSISPGVYMTNWSSAYAPQAWWWGNSITMCGLEDLRLDGGG